MEDKLISSQWLINDLLDKSFYPAIVKSALEKAPAVDAAPVVRCDSCKHHHDCGVHFCDRLGMDCPDDSEFYCKYGERETDG